MHSGGKYIVTRNNNVLEWLVPNLMELDYLNLNYFYRKEWTKILKLTCRIWIDTPNSNCYQSNSEERTYAFNYFLPSIIYDKM